MDSAYARELGLLHDTFRWARSAPLEVLEAFISRTRELPLLAVGSGGSATAAHFAALLHRHRFRGIGRHATPLELLLGEPGLSHYAVLLLSAAGKNLDILACLQASVRQQVPALATLCTQRGSPLAHEGRSAPRAYVFEDEGPAGVDGFLATNSLFGTMLLLARAYGHDVCDVVRPLPELAAVIPGLFAGRDSVQVLHGGWGSPVATDLENKLNDAALASVQVSDYRSFAHGRQVRLVRRGAETVIVALLTPETQALAEMTLRLLPQDIPVLRLTTPHEGPQGTLELLFQLLHLTHGLGMTRSMDPARPEIAEFCWKLYQLPPLPPEPAV